MAMGYKRAVLTARHEYKQLNLAFQNALDKITEQARRIKELEERK
jgi:ribosome-associated translation inhibitor RaiA